MADTEDEGREEAEGAALRLAVGRSTVGVRVAEGVAEVAGEAEKKLCAEGEAGEEAVAPPTGGLRVAAALADTLALPVAWVSVARGEGVGVGAGLREGEGSRVPLGVREGEGVRLLDWLPLLLVLAVAAPRGLRLPPASLPLERGEAEAAGVPVEVRLAGWGEALPPPPLSAPPEALGPRDVLAVPLAQPLPLSAALVLAVTLALAVALSTTLPLRVKLGLEEAETVGAGTEGVLAAECVAPAGGEGVEAGVRVSAAVRVGVGVDCALVALGVAVGVSAAVEVGEKEALVLLVGGAGVKVEALKPVAVKMGERVALAEAVGRRGVAVAQPLCVGLAVSVGQGLGVVLVVKKGSVGVVAREGEMEGETEGEGGALPLPPRPTPTALAVTLAVPVARGVPLDWALVPVGVLLGVTRGLLPEGVKETLMVVERLLQAVGEGCAVAVGVGETLPVGARAEAVTEVDWEGEPLGVAVEAPPAMAGGEGEGEGVPAARRLGETLGVGVAVPARPVAVQVGLCVPVAGPEAVPLGECVAVPLGGTMVGLPLPESVGEAPQGGEGLCVGEGVGAPRVGVSRGEEVVLGLGAGGVAVAQGERVGECEGDTVARAAVGVGAASVGLCVSVALPLAVSV